MKFVFDGDINILILIATFILGCLIGFLKLEWHKHFKSLKRNKKQVRIYVDGCWDLCHSGHYNAIRQAKALGDYLILGIHSDEEIYRAKGRWPVMNNKERVACVEACKWVDQVAFGVPYCVSLELLQRSDINADFVAHGDDAAIDSNGHSAYEGIEHKLKIFKRTPGVSTTALIERLLAAAKWERNKTKTENETKMHSISIDNNMNIAGMKSTQINIENDNKRMIKQEKFIENKIGIIGSWSQFLSCSHRIASFSNTRIPSKDDKVIYIDGIFDLFHAGHIAALKEAKKEGTFLYVGLFDDRIVSELNGPYYPLMNLQERTLNVLACQYVDEVIIGCPFMISQDMMSSLNIKTIVSTPNTEITSINDKRYKIAKQCANVKQIIPKDSKLTTLELINKIVENEERICVENAKHVKKEISYLKVKEYVAES